MSGYERIGDSLTSFDVRINLEDAERLRSIGRNILLSPATSTTIDDDTISGACVVRNDLNIPGYYDPNMRAMGLIVRDSSSGDAWQTSVTYIDYRDLDGVLGFETKLEVEVADEKVMMAKRSIYRERELTDIAITGNVINVQKYRRRTMADTALRSVHIDTLAERVDHRLRRAVA